MKPSTTQFVQAFNNAKKPHYSQQGACGPYLFSNELDAIHVFNAIEKAAPTLPSTQKARIAILVGESHILSFLPELALIADIVFCDDTSAAVLMHIKFMVDCLQQAKSIEALKAAYLVNNPNSNCKGMLNFYYQMNLEHKDILSSPERFQACKTALQSLTFLWGNYNLFDSENCLTLRSLISNNQACLTLLNLTNLHYYAENDHQITAAINKLIGEDNPFIMYSVGPSVHNAYRLKSRISLNKADFFKTLDKFFQIRDRRAAFAKCEFFGNTYNITHQLSYRTLGQTCRLANKYIRKLAKNMGLPEEFLPYFNWSIIGVVKLKLPAYDKISADLQLTLFQLLQTIHSWRFKHFMPQNEFTLDEFSSYVPDIDEEEEEILLFIHNFVNKYISKQDLQALITAANDLLKQLAPQFNLPAECTPLLQLNGLSLQFNLCHIPKIQLSDSTFRKNLYGLLCLVNPYIHQAADNAEFFWQEHFHNYKVSTIWESDLRSFIKNMTDDSMEAKMYAVSLKTAVQLRYFKPKVETAPIQLTPSAVEEKWASIGLK